MLLLPISYALLRLASLLLAPPSTSWRLLLLIFVFPALSILPLLLFAFEPPLQLSIILVLWPLRALYLFIFWLLPLFVLLLMLFMLFRQLQDVLAPL